MILHDIRIVSIYVCTKSYTIDETCERSVTGDSEKLELAFEIAIWLGWMNSALNPIIYYSNQEVILFVSDFVPPRHNINSSTFIVCVDSFSALVDDYAI